MVSSLSPQDLKSLEQTRQRLAQLTSSLSSLLGNLQKIEPLPTWSSLQQTASVISQNLSSLSQHLETHEELFARTLAYPLPAFPGLTQENLLGQLLRKKLEVNVEDWIEQGRQATQKTLSDGQRGLSEKDMINLWDWAGPTANDEARKRDWMDEYTLEERESGIKNVVTGLRRKLDDGSSDDSSDGTDPDDPDDDVQMSGSKTPPEDVQMEGLQEISLISDAEKDHKREEARKSPEPRGPALPLDEILRYMGTGAEPRSLSAFQIGR
ncbi:MAG: mediator of RNA polymerase II transcription subunit 8 [Trizodia sp. TS-e1964]|nr:MAG: mediator of RNA polymerase II transcription subunit 8 [Trizodia sp. TS-e1964]